MNEPILKQVVKDATARIDAGADPTDALIAAIGDHDLTPGRIKLAARALNGGRQLDQLYESAAPFATFPTIDPDAVIDRLGRKTAAALTAPPAPADIDAGWVGRVLGSSTRMDKRASAPNDSRLAATKARVESEANLARAVIEREKSAKAWSSALALVEAEAGRATPERRTQVEAAATDRLGKTAAVVFEHLRERGFAGAKRAALAAVPDSDPLYRATVGVIDAAGPYLAAHGAYLTAAREKAAAWGETKPKPVSTVPAVPAVPPLPPIAPKTASFVSPFVASMVGGALGRVGANEVTSPASNADLLRATRDRMFNSRDEEEMRRAESEAILHSIMSDPDNPVSGYPPARVVDHFNMLVASNPAIARNPNAVNAFLARSLQAPLATHEVGEAAKLNAMSAPTQPRILG